MPSSEQIITRPEIRALRAQLRAEEKKLDLVKQISQALSSALDLDRLLALVMEKITDLMEADRSTLYLLSEDGTELWSKVAQGGELLEIRLKVGEGIAGWVAQSSEVVNIADAYADTRFQPAVDLRSGYRTRSILCMPMRNNLGTTIGAIQVLNKKAGPFDLEDEALLSALAGQAAVAIENSKLFHSVVTKNMQLLEAQEKLEQKQRDLNLLFEIEQEMNRAVTLDDLLDRLLHRAMDLVGTSAGAIVLLEPKTGDLYFRSVVGSARAALKRLGLRLRVGEGIVGWVVKRRESAIVNDPGHDHRHSEAISRKVGFFPKNILCTPLVAEDEVLGAIELLDKQHNPRGFDQADAQLLVLIAGQASKAIQLARAKEERLQERRLASIGQMLSGVLHDLKTPMTIASGYAQLMARVGDEEERADYVKLILHQFDHMASMTKEVLAFARGESHILIRKVYMHKFVAQVTEQLRQELLGNSLTFPVKLEVDSIYRGVAELDEQKMHRVIHNIARNAVEAMPNGGTFRVTVDRDVDDLVFEFADTGVGVPVDLEHRVFDPFVTSGKAEGTGLGLAVVKKIVEEHAGQVSFRSQAGGGTVFRVAIPIKRVAQPEEPTDVSDEREAQAG